jgi:aerobic-type carbon monoxide dehydrogenase small subunit (CoxS/CutS family)
MPAIKELHVNGSRRALDADGERSLLSVLRDDLDLTGCKYGCGEGRCGACTLLLDGRQPQPSREDIVRAMSGHLCRCGAYPRIIAAWPAS